MMNRFAVLLCLVTLALSGCGRQEPANPLSLLPENAMVSVVLTQPVAAVRNMDAYVAAGAPFLGTGVVENAVAGYLEVENLDDVAALGIDPQGSIVFWMESMMPQSMAMAVSITDFPAFLALLGRLGLEFQPGQPLDKMAVFQATSESGTIYAAETRGVALLAMNRGKLSTLAGALEPAASVEIAPASVFSSVNVGMIGPMAASQIPLIAGEMNSEMPPEAAELLSLYFDAAVVLLNQTLRYDMTITFGETDITAVQVLAFKEGSDLARLIVTPDNPSLLSSIPAGDVMSAQIKMPPELTGILMNAVYQAMGLSVDPALTAVWTEMSGCAAMSFFSDGFLRFMAAYQMPQGASLVSLTGMIMDMAERTMAMLPPELAGVVVFTPCEAVEVQGVSFMTTTFSVFMPEQEGLPDSIVINYWFAEHDGLFLVETGPEPAGILETIAGDFAPASGLPGISQNGMCDYAMEVGGYLSLIRQFSPEDISLPEALPVLWITGGVTAENGVLQSNTVVSGVELVSFIGAIAMAAGL